MKLVLGLLTCSFLFLSLVQCAPIEASFSSGMKDLIEEIQKQWDAIPDDEKTDLIMKAKQFIDKRLEKPESTPESFDSSTCTLCQLVSELLYAGTNIEEAKIITFATGICGKFLDPSLCQNAIGEFGNIYLEAVETKLFEPHFMCNRYLKVCPDNSTRLEVPNFFDEILKDKPARQKRKPTGNRNYTVLHITDTHFDPDYQFQAEAHCSNPTGCCRADSQSNSTSKVEIPAGFWGTSANCDIPLRTVDKFFEWAQKNLKPDIIFFTGDNIAHNLWKQKRETQGLPTIAVAERIRDYFPDAMVFPGIGNHECFPVDQCDLSSGGMTWLAEELKSAFSWFLPAESLKSFEENLYYSRVVPELNLKVIMLNTQAFDLYSVYTFVNPTDPGDFLEWLIAELDDCEKQGTTAILVGHIPTGSSTGIYSTTIRFRAIVDRYFNTISGLFFGHTHKNQFQFMPDTYETGEFVGVEFISPSLTTFAYLNPSVNLFTLDADTSAIVESTTYTLNLTYWNQFPIEEAPVAFEFSHNLTSAYNLTDLSIDSLLKIGKGINESDVSIMSTYYYYMFGMAKPYPTEISPETRLSLQCGILDNSIRMIECNPIGALGSPQGFFFYLWNRADDFWYNSTSKK